MNTHKRYKIAQGRMANMMASEWLPLTEYAIRSGTSISTLRRKIKTNTIEFKMDEGRYLIRCDAALMNPAPPIPVRGFVSTDERPSGFVAASPPNANPAPQAASGSVEMRVAMDEMSLRWKALEARVAGLAKKMDIYSEQLSELKMLVKIFEEKLDRREL